MSDDLNTKEDNTAWFKKGGELFQAIADHCAKGRFYGCADRLQKIADSFKLVSSAMKDNEKPNDNTVKSLL